LSSEWPSPFAGQRGKKLAVAFRELGVDVFPLSDEEAAHHLLPIGKRQGFQVVECRLLLQGASIGGSDLNAIEFGQLIRCWVVVTATNQDVVAAHGLPPAAMGAFRYPMIRHAAAGPLPPTNRARNFCALTTFEGRRFELLFPEEEYENLRRSAERHSVSMAELVRRCVRRELQGK
jgi:hypothetical protein